MLAQHSNEQRVGRFQKHIMLIRRDLDQESLGDDHWRERTTSTYIKGTELYEF